MTDNIPGIRPAAPARPDFDLIADTGDITAYANAWRAFPDERETLEMLFPEMHADAFGDGEDH